MGYTKGAPKRALRMKANTSTKKRTQSLVAALSKSMETVSTKSSGYDSIKALVMSFEFNDLNLKAETDLVVKTFKDLGYETEEVKIPMGEKSWHELEPLLIKFLESESENTLHIIYYNGHGGASDETPTRKDGPRYCLEFVSHNIPTQNDLILPNKLLEKVQSTRDETRGFRQHDPLNDFIKLLEQDKRAYNTPVTSISWASMMPLIITSKSDSLIILDCCSAGLAAATEQHMNKLTKEDFRFSPFKKELIGACGWTATTSDQMSSAMCEIMNKRVNKMNMKLRKDVKNEHGIRNMSTSTFVHAMNNLTMQKYVKNGLSTKEAPAQAVHYVLSRSRKGELFLEDMKHKELAKLGHEGFDIWPSSSAS